MDAVSKGELHKLTSIATNVFKNGTEERLSDSIRNHKNYLIILNTLLRKAAENGGVHPFYIHEFSSIFAKKIEKTKNISEILKLQKKMIREYCIFVKQKTIKKYSFYVGKAITLISYDLSADLCLKNIANELEVNPSYLSSLFSKELGCTLTDYIHSQRIEEAMRLLLQTKKLFCKFLPTVALTTYVILIVVSKIKLELHQLIIEKIILSKVIKKGFENSNPFYVLCYFYNLITSCPPINGLKTSGTVIEPSAF